MWPSGELYSPGSDDWPVWTLPAPVGTNVSVSPVITVTHQFRLGLAGLAGLPSVSNKHQLPCK